MNPHLLALLALAIPLATGCGDPVPNTDPGPPEAGPPPTPADGEPAATIEPGDVPIEGEPPPAREPSQRDNFVVVEGEGVLISGTVSYSGSAEGGLFLDVLNSGDPSAGDSMMLLHSTTLDGMGAFSLEAPKNTGKVRLCAFIDVDDNGPTPGDPKAISIEPIDIEEAPIAGVELELLDDWDTQHPDTRKAYSSPSDGTSPPIQAGGDDAPPPPPVDGEPVTPEGPPVEDAPDAPTTPPEPAPAEGQGIEPGVGGEGLLTPDRSSHDMSCPFHGLGLAYLTQTTE